MGPLFIILQEKNGLFGPNVSKTMFKHPLIHVIANTSGKITKENARGWMENVLLKATRGQRKTLLLIDQCGSFKDHLFLLDGIIPPNHIQPQDVYCFRFWKAFSRIISLEILVYHKEVTLHSRNTILRLQATIYFQFQSPIFNAAFKYAWEKSGYLEKNENRERFMTPAQFCFDSARYTTPCELCSESTSSFIRRAQRVRFFCVKHLMLEKKIHYCKED